MITCILTREETLHALYTTISSIATPTSWGSMEAAWVAHHVMTIMRCETWESARMRPLSSMPGAALGLCTTVYTCMRGSSQRARSASCHMTGVSPNSCTRVHLLHICGGSRVKSPHTSCSIQYLH